MQIVSHMDSLDNHKVQEGVQGETEIKTHQYSSVLCTCRVSIFKLSLSSCLKQNPVRF